MCDGCVMVSISFTSMHHPPPFPVDAHPSTFPFLPITVLNRVQTDAAADVDEGDSGDEYEPGQDAPTPGLKVHFPSLHIIHQATMPVASTSHQHQHQHPHRPPVRWVPASHRPAHPHTPMPLQRVPHHMHRPVQPITSHHTHHMHQLQPPSPRRHQRRPHRHIPRPKAPPPSRHPHQHR